MEKESDTETDEAQIDDWDPMQQAYSDPRFNTYTTGPGANLDIDLQPCNKNKSKAYRLYVGNIPSCLNLSGLRNLLHNFGEPFDFALIPNPSGTQFGFASYHTQKEAEQAIRELNCNYSIFNLIVEFSRSDKDKTRVDEERKENELISNKVTEVYKELLEKKESELQESVSTISKEKYDLPINYIKKELDGLANKFWYENEDFTNRHCFHPHADSKHEVINSLLLEETHLFDSTNANRKIGKGRAFLAFKKDNIKRPGGLNFKPVFSAPSTVVYDSQCEHCKMYTTFKCSQCNVYICSRKCQEIICPQHKLTCTQKIYEISDDTAASVTEVSKKCSYSPESFISNVGNKIFECSVIKIYGNKFTVLGLTSPVLRERVLLKSLLNNPIDLSNRPNVGDLVLAYKSSNNSWNRAIVLADFNTYFRVALCDFGLVEDVTEIKKAPNVSGFLVPIAMCSISNYFEEGDKFHSNVTRGKKMDFEAVSVTKNMVKGNLKSGGTVLCEAMLSPWEPLFEDGGLQVCKLENGGLVTMTSFYNQHEIYVRSLKETDVLDYNLMIQDVAGDYFSKEQLDYFPRIGELVSCKFVSDGCVYRALIIDIMEDKATVSYVDFGNQEQVTLDLIRLLDLSLKKIRCFAVKVSLKGVSDRAMTMQGVDYLNAHLLNENALRIEFKESLSDGVILRLQGETKSSINAVLNNFLAPSWMSDKRMQISREELEEFEEMLNYVKLPVRENVNFLILNIPEWKDEDEFQIIGCSSSEKMLHYVYTVLPLEIHNFLVHYSCSLYSPLRSEPCLAKYKDSVWGRAICLLPAEKLVTVLFIDFGDIKALTYYEVRPCPPEFVIIPGLALSCTVKNIENQDYLKSLKAGDVCTVKVLTQENKAEYTVEILK